MTKTPPGGGGTPNPGANRHNFLGVVLAKTKTSTCDVATCDRDRDRDIYCGMHFQRAKATGDPLRPCRTCGVDIVVGQGPKLYCSDDCRPLCVAPGCAKLTRGGGEYCSPHQSSIYKHGRLPEQTWAKDKKCVVCGKTDFQRKGRKICSGACQQVLRRNNGVAPESFKQCAHCTTIIDLSVRHKSGRKTRSDVKLCRTCWRAKTTRHRMSVTALADRDGTDCKICGEAVDMSLVFPELFRASVDHILPYASGGTHDPENLQLSHLWCNLVKQNRPGFTI